MHCSLLPPLLKIMHPPSLTPMPFLWCLVTTTCLLITSTTAAHFSNETDRLALLRFKDEISQDPFHFLSSWNNTLHFCQWSGVTCGRRHPQRLTALNLTGYRLVGRISQHIANLSFLRTLDLSNNTFHGSLPEEIGYWLRLQYLVLTNNSLSGEIPRNLTHCSKLMQLILYGNKFIGSIPAELGSLSNLDTLDLGNNNLTGTIPPSLGNLSSLYFLQLPANRLFGSIPADLSRLTSLEILAISINELSGTIPSLIYNISSLQYFDVGVNRLHGSLPPDLGFKFPYLQWWFVDTNQFTGTIPLSLANATGLEIIQFDKNYFRGLVPNNLGSLGSLNSLTLDVNQLGNGKGQDFSFLDSLSNCSNLNTLSVANNNLNGALPDSLANLSMEMQWLNLGHNTIFGSIPSGIGKLVGLTALGFESNLLTGTLPIAFEKLNNMERLSFYHNKLSGEIPTSFCNMTQLYSLVLAENNLQGSIPSCLENCRHLQFIYLFSNNFRETFPKQLFNFPILSHLEVQNNYLTGNLSEVGRLQALEVLDFSDNYLSGEIPTSLGDCLGLEDLHLGGNFFQGSIPPTFSFLRGLQYLDLSHNNLSGKIPEFLENITLQYLNLSFNNFEGKVPKQGVFGNASAVSLLGNSKLCGGSQELHLPACIQKAIKKNGMSDTTKVKVILTTVLLSSFALFCLFLSLFWLRNSKTKPPPPPPSEHTFVDVSYAELLNATDGFSSANLIGTGRFGSVYKGVLQKFETSIAVKVIDLLQEGAIKSFMAECEALRSIRHRNLVKILTCCSSIDFKGDEFKALIFEYMSNGSLNNWLHGEGGERGRNLSLIQRLNIAMDVASALDYLHHRCQAPIIHRDLKPTNILLDSDMVAHVGDFGLAKFASAHTNSVGVKGSIGYIAPEYAMGKATTTEGDVYSYGILLLEMLIGRKPIDDMFEGNLTLHHFVKLALPDRIMEIADPQILLEAEANQSNKVSVNLVSKIHDCLVLLAKIGILCSLESPRERLKMNEVVAQIHAVRRSYMEINQGRQRRSEILDEGSSYLSHY